MKYFKLGHPIDVTWSVYRGGSSNKESFTGKMLKVFLVCAANSYYMEYSIAGNGDITFSTPASLPVGVYTVEALWIINDGNLPQCVVPNRNIMKAAVFSAFAISNSVPETPEYKLQLNTGAVPFGTDGLSAYQIAVIHGLTTDDEDTWISSVEAILRQEEARQEAEHIREENAAEDRRRAAGDHGQAVSGIVVHYASSESATVPPTSGWSTDIPTVGSGRFLWTRTTTSYNDDSKPVTVAYNVGLLTLVNGAVTLDKLADEAKPMMELHSDTQIAALTPNVLHAWEAAVDELHIEALEEPEHDDIANEYKLQFVTSGNWAQEESPFAELTGVVWNTEPVCWPGCIYEVSILNNVGLFVEIENE